MPIILFIVLIALLFCFGWQLVTLLKVESRSEKFGLAFLLSFWLLTLGMMSLYLLTNRFTAGDTFALAIIGNLGLLLLSGRAGVQDLQSDVQHLIRTMREVPTAAKKYLLQLNWLEVVILGFLSFIIGLTIWSNLTWPVADWDAVALYDFRAIMIEQVGTWADGKKLGYFYQYPPFTSLLHASVYLIGFKQAKILYSLLFISFLTVFYQLLRRRTSRTKTLIGCLLVTIAPLLSGHLTMAYTNLPYTIYFSLAVIYAWQWLDTSVDSDMKLAALLAAGSLWIRSSEPFWIILIGVFVIGKVVKKTTTSWGSIIIYSLILLACSQYWDIYLTSLELPPPPPSAQSVGLIDAVTLGTIIRHAFTVTDYLLRYMVRPLLTLLIPFGLVIAFDQKLNKTMFIRQAVASMIILLGIVAAGTYYFSFTYNSWDLIGESVTRLVMFCVPLLIYIIALSNFWEKLYSYLKITYRAVRKQ